LKIYCRHFNVNFKETTKSATKSVNLKDYYEFLLDSKPNQLASGKRAILFSSPVHNVSINVLHLTCNFVWSVWHISWTLTYPFPYFHT